MTSKSVGKLKSTRDPSGKKIYALRPSSYVEHLQWLNAKLLEAGLKPMEIIEADGDLETEDLLEMVNAGIIHYTVSDSHRAQVWAGVLSNIVLNPEASIYDNARIAWAVRHQNPLLLQELNGFVKKTARTPCWATSYSNAITKTSYGLKIR